MTYTLTRCPDHGERVVPDLGTLAALVPVVRACMEGNMTAPYDHHADHVVHHDECWQCCPIMEFDPERILPVLSAL